MDMLFDYVVLTEVPAYERYRGNGEPANAIKWGNDAPPPPIGTVVRVIMNRIGPAEVTGYFVERGFLGLLVRMLDPPEWHRKQHKGVNYATYKAHIFGTEFKLMEVAA